MSSRRLLFVVGAPTPQPRIAVGAERARRRVDLAKVRAAATGRGGKMIELTCDQWQFLRGVYAMNPEAPRGLPPGDHAVLAQDGGDSGSMLFFIDGDKPCAPMHAPPALLSLIERVTMADGGNGP